MHSIDQFYGDILDPSKYRVIVQSDGTVHFFTAGSITTSCVLDLTYFPFDAQACYIHLDSWTYSVTQVHLRNISSVLNTDLYHPNGQWQLERTHVSYVNVIEDGDTYVELKFNVYLSRKPQFYSLTLVMPCALMSVMVLFVFLLPVDAGEKVSLSATVLLSFSVFQLLILDIMPQTSDYTPVMSEKVSYNILYKLSVCQIIYIFHQ